MQAHSIIPPERTHYLREISGTVRAYRAFVEEQVQLARKWFQLQGARDTLAQSSASPAMLEELDRAIEGVREQLSPDTKRILQEWPGLKEQYQQDYYVVKVRDREISTPLFTETLSGSRIPKVALPRYEDWGEIVRWSLLENVPGRFPFTAGVFPLKRTMRILNGNLLEKGHLSVPTADSIICPK